MTNDSPRSHLILDISAIVRSPSRPTRNAHQKRKAQLDEQFLIIGMQQTPAVEEAILLGAQSHLGRKDKAGYPYVLHVLRVSSGWNPTRKELSGQSNAIRS